MERTTVRLPEALLDRARKKAAAEGRTLTSLIEEGLRAVVGERAKRATAKRVLPRVSKATGGLMPGIDPAKLATIAQELDDIEYVERMKRGFK
jgi:hypothetical protein